MDFFRKLSQYNKVMGRFSDVKYDAIITDRMSGSQSQG